MGKMDKKKKKVAGVATRTLDSVKDDRFAHVLKNPVYRPVPKREKKIEIDKRFQAMFSDARFKLKYKVDKRGRAVETTTDENLKRYYNVEHEEDKVDEDDTKRKSDSDKSEDEDGGSDSSDDEEGSQSADSNVEGNVKVDDITAPRSSKGKLKLDELTRKKLHSAEVDYARGEADLTDDSSSDDDDDSVGPEDDDAPLDHGWGELDKDAPRSDDDSTRRLALCNMDWDRVRAVDLMVILNSFVPAGGVIESVHIYPSEFGKERMAEEEVQGPRELKTGNAKLKVNDSDEEEEEDSEMSDDENFEEGAQYHREKLRQYQLNRLKYYYAVAQFDSAATAEKVYSECDGMEYESSSAKIDLRFVPDDMTFDDDPKDTCTEMPQQAKYRPRFFTTTALQQVKVDLTWDETDPLRKELTEKIFDPKEKVDDEDIRAYLATSSESEGEEESDNEDADGIKKEIDSEEGGQEVVESTKKSSKDSKQDSISKYKALLQSIETSEKKEKEKDVEMEITWGVGLKDTTEKLVKKKLEETQQANRTPWEEQLDKRKEKRSKRKQDKKREESVDEPGSDSSDSEEASEDQPFSDDDVDVDMNDEYFRNEMKNNDVFAETSSKKKKDKKKGKKDDKARKNTSSKADPALELLLMDEDDNKRHFSMKKIINEENESKSKSKRKFKKRRKLDTVENAAHQEDFEIDVQDERFSALFNSHHFNVDPSDPNFKRTKAMEKIVAEKQKRRPAATTSWQTEDTDRKPNNAPSSNSSNGISDQSTVRKKAELSYLVKSIKRNTENLKSRKANKLK